MQRSRLLLILLCGLAAPAAAAPPVGYAQATDYFQKDSRPTLYQPLNLLDAREITAWCSASADPLDDALHFGFKGVAKVDEIRIYTGNGFSEQTFQEFSRAKKFLLRGPDGGRTFTVGDQRGLQAVAINPPLTASELTLEILDQYPAEDPEAVVCITDVVFYSDGKPLNGSWLTPKLKYDKRKAPLLGTWYGGYEGAPDHYLSFYFDGTYRFAYEPYDAPGKRLSYGGDYAVRSSRLTLELPKKGRVQVKVRREKKIGSEDGRMLLLDGPLPEELKRPFRSRP